MGYSENPENIGNLKSSDEEYEALIDAVITSPPYAHESTASKPTKLEELGLFRIGHSKETPYTEEDYREWDKHKEGNIGKRRLFIRVPCSPEEAQFHDTRPERKGTIWEWTKEVEATPEIIEKIQRLKSEKKGKSETYLEAMLKVYGEMWKVLKPGGLAIIIVKPFQRNFKIVDLPYHTYLLMNRVGFVLEKLYKLRLRQMSFWRILTYKKHPNVPRIMHEWILVCRKGGVARR
jgi:DNA modification methylase